jgi:hypothetical protein
MGSGLDPHFVLVNFGARLDYMGGSLPISFECSKFCHNAQWKHLPFKIDTCTILLIYIMNILRFLLLVLYMTFFKSNLHFFMAFSLFAYP